MKTNKNDKNLNKFEQFKLSINPRKKFETLNSEYKHLVDEIKKELGSLEDIRIKLDLSRRQIAKLLMVDPSAWTRWTKGDQDAPPHVYQALKWYTQLIEKLPEVHAPLKIDEKIEFLRKDADLKLQKLKSQIDQIQTTKIMSSDPYAKFSGMLSDNFKALSDRLIEFQNLKGVGQLEILKYDNDSLKEKLKEMELKLSQFTSSLKKSAKKAMGGNSGKVSKEKKKPAKTKVLARKAKSKKAVKKKVVLKNKKSGKSKGRK